MPDWIDRFVFLDELDESARSELDAMIEKHGDETIAAAFDEWQYLREILRREFGKQVHDRRSLVHFAMWRHGHASLLSEDELRQVESMLPHFEGAHRHSEAFRAIVRRIADEQDDFVETWRVHAGSSGIDAATPAPVSIRIRRDNQRLSNFVWRAAAVFVLVASTAALYMGLGVDSQTVTLRSGQEDIESAVLDDGTLVRLISGAELSYDIPTKDDPFNRRVRLKGRALFRVTPGDGQFVVETPAAVTTVWGTTFGLDSDESFTEVVLAEGRVSVVSRRDSRHPVVLSPGEMTRVVGAREPTPPVHVNITDALSYTKLFVFRNEKTFMIATKLTEHFGVPVSVHPDLAQEAVTGEFERDWSVEYILQTVARSLDGRVSGSETEGYRLIPLESSGR